MRKLIAVVALATGLMLGAVSNAATVDIFLTDVGAGNWELSVTNNGLVGGVGAINMLVSGLDNVAFAAAPGLSIPDSLLSLDPLSDGYNNFLILQNTAAGVSIADIGVPVVLATLSSSLGPICGPAGEGSNHMTGLGCVGASMSENLLGSGTVFNAAGVEIATSEFSITVVPEPTTVLLLGLGLAALGFVRRSA